MATGLRERVLRSAVEYIAEHGPDGLSFRQVAADAGVSHQAPYHHFGDRRSIFQAIALEGFRMFVDELRGSGGGAEPGVSMCERYVEFAIAHRGHFRVMFRADLCAMDESPELRRAGDDAFGVLLAEVGRILGPEASVDEVRVQATMMWSLAHGLATLFIDGPLERKIGKVADRRALVRAVARSATQDRRDIST